MGGTRGPRSPGAYRAWVGGLVLGQLQVCTPGLAPGVRGGLKEATETPCPATKGAASLGPNFCPGGGLGCRASVLPCPSRPPEPAAERAPVGMEPEPHTVPLRRPLLRGAPAAAHPAPLPLRPRKARRRLVETLYCAGGGMERQPLLEEGWAAGTANPARLQLLRWVPAGVGLAPLPPRPAQGGQGLQGGRSIRDVWAGPPESAGRWAAVVQAGSRSPRPGPPRTGLWKRADPEETPGAPSPPPRGRGPGPSAEGPSPSPACDPLLPPWPSCCASSARGVSLGASRTPKPQSKSEVLLPLQRWAA